jgi:hypothetical protein
MSFETDFLEMMTTIATYEPFDETNFYGEPLPGPTFNVPCHVTYKRKIIRGNSDEESVSTAQIQLPPPGFAWTPTSTDPDDPLSPITIPTIAINDLIVLPQDGIRRRVLETSIFTDDSALTVVHHQSASLT